MKVRGGAVMASAAAGTAVAAVLVFAGGSETRTAPGEPAVSAARATPASQPAPAYQRSAREDCSTRSEASFPRAFTDPRNLVVGPLVLIGGAFTPATAVREFGGNKFPLLVKAGHTVTVRLAHNTRRAAGLAYGPLPQGEVRLRDA